MGTLEMIIIGSVAALCFGGGAIFMTIRYYSEEMHEFEEEAKNLHAPIRPHENYFTDAEARLSEEKRSA